MAETTPTFDASQLIRTHQVGVWRYLRALGCEPSLADDLTQETFVWLLERPFQDYQQKATAAYLRKVARSFFINYQRREGRYVAVEEIDMLDATWEKLADSDGGDELLEALKTCWPTLTERAQTALDMRFRGRQKRTDIASKLNLSDGGAKNLMQRAKKTLKECIERRLKHTKG